MSCFLRSLEANTRMDLATKMSVVEYTKKLFEDAYEHSVLSSLDTSSVGTLRGAH